MTSELSTHFFRHEYGRLVALLSRRAGLHHLELVEDSVQSALLAALESWGKTQVPDNPSAWLFRVAQNHLVGELRRRGRRSELLDAHAAVAAVSRELLLTAEVSVGAHADRVWAMARS